MCGLRGDLRLMCLATLGGLAVYLAASTAAWAVPSFARQTGLACEACHTVFPELTHFGRTFKANGYVLDNLKQIRDVESAKDEELELSQMPPLSIMVIASYTDLRTALPDLSSDGIDNSSQKGTAAVPQQLSLFYAGKIAPHMGGFIQLTYGNDTGTITIDNTDLRLANMALLSDERSLVYGASLNNNPTVSDLFNSTPAWGFPYAASNAVVSPLAGTQIDGALAQNVAGLTGYLYWNESLYVEAGAYVSAVQGATNLVTGAAGPLDGATSNVISGAAPYWRVSYEYDTGPHSIAIGAYGLDVSLYPGGTSDSPVPLHGKTNHFQDVAGDLQYQYLGDQHLLSVAATYIDETMHLDASVENSTAAHAHNDLKTWRLDSTYYYRHRIGGTLGYFSTTGSADSLLYPSPEDGSAGVVTSANNKPDTNGWIAELNYVPWLNTKFSLQYTQYNRFNGGGSNYDGVGRSASGNDSWYFLVWFSY